MDPSVKEELTPAEAIANPPKPKIPILTVLCWCICFLTQALAFFFARSSHYVSLLMLLPALLICPAVLRLRDRREPPRVQIVFLVIFYLVSAAVTYGLFTVIDRSIPDDPVKSAREFAESVVRQSETVSAVSSADENESADDTTSESPSVSDVSQASSVISSAPAAQTEVADVIYAAPSGKRYHYKASCCGKNAEEITREEASQRGLTPCKVCAKRDITDQNNEVQ